MYQFWTPLKYVPGSGIFTKDGKKFKMDSIEWIQGRSTRLDTKFCVAAVYSNEYPNQSACEGKCNWQSYTLTPANCLNPIGTICKHEDSYRRDCKWKASYTDDNMKAVEDTAVTSFGNDYEEAWRSTYKQTFGNRVCGSDDREMMTTKWKLPSYFYVTYDYDFLETYWIVDEDGFKNEGNPNEFCTVANFKKRYGSYRMTTRKVPCTEWHFYLCQEKDK
ncbi:unnamed protein product [Orchesella dallaii]|uniref:C-type lectin domain-containing protein n=1 Tax=Orchesella dallaii TaxID=48710 RepID=A0ABP1QU33_9HEXA